MRSGKGPSEASYDRCRPARSGAAGEGRREARAAARGRRGRGPSARRVQSGKGPSEAGYDRRRSGAWRAPPRARTPRGASQSRLESCDFRGVHLCEAEELLAEILQRRADQVEFAVVDDEETVVEVLAEALFTSLSTNARASQSWPS